MRYSKRARAAQARKDLPIKIFIGLGVTFMAVLLVTNLILLAGVTQYV